MATMPKVIKGKPQKIKGGNKTNIKLVVRRPDGSIREIQNLHNAVEQAMIGREVYWSAYEVTSEPVAWLAVSNSGSAATYTYATTATNQTAVSGSYPIEWSASHTATQTETITTLELLNADGVAYSTATVSVSMSNGETLDVYWTHTFTAASEDIGILTDYYLWAMRENFRTASTTFPISTTLASRGIIANHNDGATDTEISAVAIISGGGTTSDTSVTFYADIKNTLSAGDLTDVYAGYIYYTGGVSATEEYVVDYDVSPDLTWTLNQTYRITISISWADVT